MCFFALLALIIFGIVLIFAHVPGGSLVYCILRLIIVAGLIMFDFQRLRHSRDMDSAPLIAASIFLNALNVFLFSCGSSPWTDRLPGTRDSGRRRADREDAKRVPSGIRIDAQRLLGVAGEVTQQARAQGQGPLVLDVEIRRRAHGHIQVHLLRDRA